MCPVNAPDVEALADGAALALIAFRVADEEARAATARAGAVRTDALMALHGAGWSVRRIAAELDLSSARVGQLLQAGRARREQEWAEPIELRPMRSTALDDYRAARHAQELREEAFTGGHAEERRAFYGSIDAPAMDGAEQALTWRAWLEGSRQEVSA